MDRKQATEELLLHRAEGLSLGDLLPKKQAARLKKKCDEAGLKRLMCGRIKDTWQVFGEETPDRLCETYRLGFEHHRFYCEQIWKLGAVMIPLSFGVASYTAMKVDGACRLFGYVFAAMVYGFWFCHYLRLDGLVLRNRVYLLALEKVLGFPWYTFRRGEYVKVLFHGGIKNIWIGFTVAYGIILAVLAVMSCAGVELFRCTSVPPPTVVP